MSTNSDCHIRVLNRDWAHPDGESLRKSLYAETDPLYAPLGVKNPSPIVADDVCFHVVAYLSHNTGDGTAPLPIACATLCALDPSLGALGDAEIKGMYVRNGYRGAPLHVGKAVIAALEDRARSRGWKRLAVTTGNLQMAAMKFYQKEGYKSIDKFGLYLDCEVAICYVKDIYLNGTDTNLWKPEESMPRDFAYILLICSVA